MNKTIPTPLAILIILLVIAIIIGVALWICPEKKIVLPQDETADWQIYRSEQMGFEIKYPSDLDVSEERILSTGTEVDFYKVSQIAGKEVNDIIMSIRAGVRYSQELMREYTLDEWINASFLPLKEGESEKTIVFGAGNYEGIKVEAYKSVGIIKLIPYVFTQKNRNIYEITGNVPSLPTGFPKDYDPNKIFDQMLSTFKFLDKTVDWQTYKNEKYGVEFKYPENYSYKESLNNPEVYFYQLPSENQYNPDIFFSVQSEPMTLLFQGTFGIVSRANAIETTAKLDISEDITINYILWEKEVWSLQAGLKVISFNTKYKDNYYTIALGIGGSYDEKETILNKILLAFRFLE